MFWKYVLAFILAIVILDVLVMVFRAFCGFLVWLYTMHNIFIKVLFTLFLMGLVALFILNFQAIRLFVIGLF